MRMGFHRLSHDRVILAGFSIKVGNFSTVHFNNPRVFNSKRVIGTLCILNVKSTKKA